MKKPKLFFFLLTLSALALSPMRASEPEENLYLTPQRLFHIARSINKNLVCYDANLVGGKLDTQKPLNVYWVNREEHMGEKNGLSFIQRKMAYGYKVVAEGNNTSTVTLTAYNGRKLEICQQGTVLLLIGLLTFVIFSVMDRKLDKQLGLNSRGGGGSEEERCRWPCLRCCG